MNILTKLFCKHKYKLIISLPCTFKCDDDTVLNLPIDLFECKICGKRKVIREPDCFYRGNLLKAINLWVKGQLDLEDLK